MPRERKVTVPTELAELLDRDAAARSAFDALPPSHRREWADHVAEPKQAATRRRRAQRCVDELTNAWSAGVYPRTHAGIPPTKQDDGRR